MTHAKRSHGAAAATTSAVSARTPVTAILNNAAAAARFAPSIHNTQPWEWDLRSGVLELWADRDRRLSVADPEKRMLTVSCGAALHYCRAALAAQGWEPDVARFPDPRSPMLLARVRLGSRIGIDRRDLRHFRTMARRRTDRRRLDARPVGAAVLDTLRDAVEAENTCLYLVPADRVTELVRIVQRARELEEDAPSRIHERERWVGGDGHRHSGIPGPVLSEHSDHGRVPPRFGDPSVPGDDRHGRYVVVFADGDTPVDWLRAGEALNRLWLTATEAGLAVLPMSLPLEFDATRELLRQLLSETGHPVMVVRVGHPGPEPEPVRTPRIPEEAIVKGSRP
ncbi:MAG TPA: nitroreductase family protein [Stackebrandtia sp.]|uniref:Acg family FMN-binding oxidoreductase n=1 Tax=Stackebrandtia sp. TaxID=2023065 RepID=UPI002D4C0DB5|nr:nitroreductase family protein [Stackebrandtia sp.]HZE38337.1 nitroreductase family protein [Stackebrandtia sp.]